MRPIDLTGQRFGRLVALSPSGISAQGKCLWLCQCDCGVETTAISGNLKSGTSTSCGCFASEQISERAKTRNHKHGHAKRSGFSSEYRSWSAMTKRCKYPCVNSYKDYGGRGISVCERWNDFKNFLSDMGPKPSRKHSIDRIDVNGNYQPENCRWATGAEQAANKRPADLRWLRRDA